MHVLDDLKRLEEKYPRELVVIGVHSAKFTNERETENIRQAIRRHEVANPVVNGRDFANWRAYGVRAWPTFMVIDTEGHVVGAISGEANYELLDQLVSELVAEARAKGILGDSQPRGAAQPWSGPAGLAWRMAIRVSSTSPVDSGLLRARFGLPTPTTIPSESWTSALTRFERSR